MPKPALGQITRIQTSCCAHLSWIPNSSPPFTPLTEDPHTHILAVSLLAPQDGWWVLFSQMQKSNCKIPTNISPKENPKGSKPSGEALGPGV